MSVSLSERALLVEFEIKRWTARRRDKTVSDQVADDHQAARDSGNYNKLLLPKHALTKIDAAATAIRDFVYAETLPWRNDGTRILSSSNFLSFTARFSELSQAYEDAADAFVPAYPLYIAEARRTLGRLWNAKDYPHSDDVRSRFGVEIFVTPIPSGKDWRIDLGDEMNRKIEARIEAQTRAAVAAGLRDVWDRLYKAVKHLRDRLKLYDPEAARAHPFRDTVTTNLIELVTLLPRLNITDDPDLAAMSQRLIDSLCQHSPETLREDNAIRHQVEREATEILAVMAGYCSPQK